MRIHPVDVCDPEQRAEAEVEVSGFKAPEVAIINSDRLGRCCLRHALLFSQRARVVTDTTLEIG